MLKLYHQKQHSLLHQILISYEPKIIKAPDGGALINANAPANAELITEILNKFYPE